MSVPPLLGVVRVLTTDDRDLLEAHGRVIEDEQGVPVLSRCIPDQPHGIHDAASHSRAVPKIVDLARELVAGGATSVMISCAADPGLAETRAAVTVPVWGAGSTAAGVAKALGGPVGVLGITPAVPEPITRVLGDRIVAHVRPRGVTRTTDLLTPDGRAAALDAVGDLTGCGAETVVFACTGLTSIDLAAPARQRWGVPVVDAVRATGAIAALATS